MELIHFECQSQRELIQVVFGMESPTAGDNVWMRESMFEYVSLWRIWKNAKERVGWLLIVRFCGDDMQRSEGKGNHSPKRRVCVNDNIGVGCLYHVSSPVLSLWLSVSLFIFLTIEVVLLSNSRSHSRSRFFPFILNLSDHFFFSFFLVSDSLSTFRRSLSLFSSTNFVFHLRSRSPGHDLLHFLSFSENFTFLKDFYFFLFFVALGKEN